MTKTKKTFTYDLQIQILGRSNYICMSIVTNGKFWVVHKNWANEQIKRTATNLIEKSDLKVKRTKNLDVYEGNILGASNRLVPI